MREILRYAAALTLFAGLAAGLLVAADTVTRPARQAAVDERRSAAFAQVLPAFDNQPLQEAVTVGVTTASGPHTVVFHAARQGATLVGYAAECDTAKGYGGRLVLLAGVTPEGTVRALTVTEQHETPGLGTPLTERKATRTLPDLIRGDGRSPAGGLPPNRHLDQYHGRSLDKAASLKLKKDGGDIDGVSGATVTSRAIADAMQTLAAAFAELRRRPPSATPP